MMGGEGREGRVNQLLAKGFISDSAQGREFQGSHRNKNFTFLIENETLPWGCKCPGTPSRYYLYDDVVSPLCLIVQWNSSRKVPRVWVDGEWCVATSNVVLHLAVSTRVRVLCRYL